MVQSVPYRLFELINNSRRAQGLQLYQLSISHWNHWGFWLKEILLPLAGHGGFELMKGCLLWTKFLHTPCHAPSLNFQMASPDLDPCTMFLIHCAVIAALFFFLLSISFLLHNPNFSAGALAAMVRQIPASPCLVQGAWLIRELGEPWCVPAMQRWCRGGDKTGLKQMTHLSCEHVTYKIGPRR